MLYYEVVEDGYDYFNKNSALKGELFTPKERETKVRYISDDHFKPVHISKRQVFFSFGCRFPKSR